MQLVQVLGFSAFIAASLVLGGRLLLLWRRTGEVPELAIGLSFLLGGGFGYACWFAFSLSRLGVEGLPASHTIVVVALGLTCIGAFTNAVGIHAAFRPGDRWATALLAVFGC